MTTEDIPGPYHILGIIHGTCVQSASLARDATQAVRSWVGGELDAYTKIIETSTSVALDRLAEKAAAIGADAVIGVKISTANVVHGGAEIIAYGTAVKLQNALGARRAPAGTGSGTGWTGTRSGREGGAH